MNVIILTVFLGLILVSLAVALFFYISATSKGSSPEQDSLLPLQDDEPVSATEPTAVSIERSAENPSHKS